MLVLTRRTSDQILIPSLGITLEVLSIKGNVVKLGISAPQEVRILRGELKGIGPAFAKTQAAAEPAKKEIPKRASSLKAYLQRVEKHDTGCDMTEETRPSTEPKSAPALASGSRSASQPVLFHPEESSELVRETAAGYEICT